jgi:hypothetical protein
VRARGTVERPDVLVGEEDLGLDPDGKGDALRVSEGREGLPTTEDHDDVSMFMSMSMSTSMSTSVSAAHGARGGGKARRAPVSQTRTHLLGGTLEEWLGGHDVGSGGGESR